MVLCSPPSVRPHEARGRLEHPAETRAEDVWTPVAGWLRDTLTESTYDTWFGQAHPRSFNGGELVVEVPNDFTRDWIEGHFLDLVSRAAIESGPSGVVVSFAVGERVQARSSAAQPEAPVAVESTPAAAATPVSRARGELPGVTKSSW